MKSYSLVLLMVELDHILFYAGAECTAFYLSSIKSVLRFLFCLEERKTFLYWRSKMIFVTVNDLQIRAQSLKRELNAQKSRRENHEVFNGKSFPIKFSHILHELG